MSLLPWKRILAATDFSSFGNQAVAAAQELAEQAKAELHVVHVVKDADDAGVLHGIAGVIDPNNPDDEENEWLKEILGESGSVRRIQAVEMGSNVAEKIAHYADSKEVDLIVLASHGRTGIKRLWLGSIAEQVLRSAHCPVLIIRPGKMDLEERE